MDKEIKIKKAVLHILDNNITLPVLSNNGLELEGEITEFLEKHIGKIFDDNNLKSARFIPDDNNICNICNELRENDDNFVNYSIDIASILFEIMLKNVDIAPADLICCIFYNYNKPFLAILKLNYKTGFTHYVQQTRDGSANTIIRHKTILPSETQKVDECVIVNLSDLSISIIEKEYEINGEKEFYLSKRFLRCTTELSNNAKIKILDKTAQKINKKYFDEDFDKTAKLKQVVADSIEETSAVVIDKMVEAVFENNLDIRNEYISEIQKAGLTEKTITIPESIAEKKFKTHKIKTDTGIEINFPLSYYNNKEKMEIINNPDGTLSIVIKNVGKILNK